MNNVNVIYLNFVLKSLNHEWNLQKHFRVFAPGASKLKKMSSESQKSEIRKKLRIF